MSNPLASAHEHLDGADGSCSESDIHSDATDTESHTVSINDDDDNDDDNDDEESGKSNKSRRHSGVSHASKQQQLTTSSHLRSKSTNAKDNEIRKRTSSTRSTSGAKAIEPSNDLRDIKLDELHLSEKIDKSLNVPASSRYWNRPKLFFMGIVLWSLFSQLIFDISDHMGYMISLAVYIPLLVLMCAYIIYDRFQFMRKEKRDLKKKKASSAQEKTNLLAKNGSKYSTGRRTAEGYSG